MNFDDTPDDRAFRDEFRAFLNTNHPGDAPVDTDAAFEFRRAWQRTLSSAGWAAPGWPREWGGREATVSQRVIIQEEMALGRVPPIINAIGVWNIGPTLLEFATEEQKKRWLPGMLNADEIWCQGFSEPGAGSDLAALSTRATPDGDGYVVDGQKVWISYGHRADRCFLLCRTGDDRYAGMTILGVDMHAPGVETRPIKEITGEAGFVELFLDGVRVPQHDRVGEEGQGWKVAMSTLTHERVGTVTYGIQLRQKLEALLKLQQAWPSDPVAARLQDQELAALWTQIEIIRLTALRAVTKASRGENPWPEVPIGKLLWSTTAQQLAEAGMHAFGMDGLRWRTDEGAPDAGRWAFDTVHSRMTTIGAGTTEIQKNILAERALGLPRE